MITQIAVAAGGRNEETYSKYAEGIRKKVSERKAATAKIGVVN